MPAACRTASFKRVALAAAITVLCFNMLCPILDFAPAPRRKQHPGANLLMGGAAGTIAATVCYPLDTIRRRMQMKGTMYSGQVGVCYSVCCTCGGKAQVEFHACAR